MALSFPAVNQQSPLSEVDNTAMAAGQGITRVGVRDQTTGLPTGSGGVQTLVTQAYELLAWPVLRDQLIFDRFATVKPTRVTHNGASVQFNFVDDLNDDPAAAKLDELYDVAPSALVSWPHNITMWEYGQAVTTTALLDNTSMIPIDPIAAERVGRAAGSTVDRLVLAAIEAAGGIQNDGTAGAAPVDVGVVADPSGSIRAAKQYFQENNVAPFMGGLFGAVITPAEETVLRSETDAAGWRYWQAGNADAGGGHIAQGSVGVYEGFAFFTSNRISQAHFFGKDGVAKCHSTGPGYGSNPSMVIAPQTDRLRRFASIGWKHLVGYDRFRAEAITTADLTAVV